MCGLYCPLSPPICFEVLKVFVCLPPWIWVGVCILSTLHGLSTGASNLTTHTTSSLCYEKYNSNFILFVICCPSLGQREEHRIFWQSHQLFRKSQAIFMGFGTIHTVVCLFKVHENLIYICQKFSPAFIVLKIFRPLSMFLTKNLSGMQR